MPVIVKADTLAQQSGVKLLVYGPPGTAKTPLCATAPRPILLSVETGTRSLAGMQFPVCHTRIPKEISDFFAWFAQSNEARAYDTLCIDSISEIAEMILLDESGKTSNLQRAYGETGKKLKSIVRGLNTLKSKHVYQIAKLDTKQLGETGMRWPFMPGGNLSSFLPHEVDEIYYISRRSLAGAVPNAPPGEVLCFQTFGESLTLARSRSSRVDPFEFPDLGKVFSKIMAR